VDDESFGFRIVTAMDFETQSLAEIVARVRARIGDAPLYVSIDIDVLDPGTAPGTGTPEAGGLTSRELLGVLRGLRGLHLCGADVVEVSPAYDHAEVTSMAASHVIYELISLLAVKQAGNRG
jgi:agmatinase